MKKRIVVLLFAACLLLAACQAEDPENRLETTPEETGSTEKEMPDVMKELAQNEAVEWMAGLWVEIPSGELQERTQGVEAYACESSGIQATVTLQNGLEKIQPYYLMVFADGLPVEFQIEGDTYQRYPLELTPSRRCYPWPCSRNLPYPWGAWISSCFLTGIPSPINIWYPTPFGLPRRKGNGNRKTGKAPCRSGKAWWTALPMGHTAPGCGVQNRLSRITPGQRS